ncbi:S1 family peptidase [Streptomyces sp. NPDC002138]|uniref:S1 family peptidase n=1 Tax=Streptomyces sp. NPDC002138 TaxID=3154410 RepID=UPI00332AC6E4
MSTPLSASVSASLRAGALALGLLATAAVPAYAAPAPDGPRTGTATATATATATPRPDPDAAAMALMRRQRPLLDAAHQLRQAGTAALPGFSGITVDPERSTLHLYWDGPLPAAAQRTVRRLGGPSVRIEVGRAPAPDPGGTGAARQVPVAAGTAAGAVAGTTDPAPAPRPPGRVNDRAPVSGGALLITQPETCTAGFGVVSEATGRKQLLTAGHCGPVGSPWFNGDGEFLGNAVSRHPEADALVIDVNSSDRVWHGAVSETLDGIDEAARTVTEARSPEVGQYVCTSGAVSGTHCGLRVTRTGVVVSVAGTDVPDQIEAEQTGHVAAAGNGDSGGPVYSATTSTGPVMAHGMITAYDRQQTAPCSGAPTGNGRNCSWRVYFTDVRAVLKATGTRLPHAACPAHRAEHPAR